MAVYEKIIKSSDTDLPTQRRYCKALWQKVKPKERTYYGEREESLYYTR